MVKLTIRGLWAHRGRLALSAVAVVLGVAFVAGSLALTETLRHTYDAVFTGARSGTDLVVRLDGPVGPEGSGERFAADVRERVAAVPGVWRAVGVVQGQARVVGRGGEPVGTGVAPNLALSWTPTGRADALQVVGAGRPPRNPDEVALDVATAVRAGVGVGDRVRVTGVGRARSYRVTARISVGGVTDLGGVTVAAFDLPTAQRVVGAGTELDEVAVRVDRDADLGRVRTRVAAAVGPRFTVETAAVAASRAGVRVRDLLDVVTAALLAFSVLGVVVALLLVGQTFAVVGAQRRREVALLRVAGAGRGQVVGMAVGEAAVVGLTASAVGVAVGIGLAAGALAGLRATGAPAPAGGLHVGWSTTATAFLIGVAASVVASLPAALRAFRRPVLVALADVPRPIRRGRSRLLVGLVGVAVAGIAAGVATADDAASPAGPLALVVVGAVALVGAAVLSLGPILGWSGRIGTTGRSGRPARVARRLGARDLARDPRRAVATAGTLVVVTALVVAALTFAASARASVAAAVDGGVRAQVVLRDAQFTGFSPQAADRVAAVASVRAVAPLRFRKVRVDGRVETVAATRGSDFSRTVDLDVVAGHTAALGPGRVLLAERLARDLGVEVGDAVTVQLARTSPTLEVVGVYARDDFTGAYTVPIVMEVVDYAAGFGTDEPDTLVYVRTAGPPDRAERAVRAALARDFPDVQVRSRAAYRAGQMRSADRVLAGVLALVVLAAVTAVLGVANVLVLAVVERTRTIGLLRAVGMTGAQVRAMLRAEAVRVTMVGAAVGVGVGLVWGLAVAAVATRLGVTVLAVPFLRIALVVGLAAAAGTLAAVVPARRAVRVDVLAAVGTG